MNLCSCSTWLESRKRIKGTVVWHTLIGSSIIPTTHSTAGTRYFRFWLYKRLKQAIRPESVKVDTICAKVIHPS